MNALSVSKRQQSKMLKHKRRFCRIEGCVRIVKSQGVCQRHGAKPRTCKIEGCTKQAQGNFNGMCKAHARGIAGYTKRSSCERPAVEPPSSVVSSRMQVATTCDVIKSNDLIGPSVQPLPEEYQSSSRPFKPNRRFCKVECCTSVVKSQGLCQRHGAVPVRCKVTGCAKQAQGTFKGMCKAHHQVCLTTQSETSALLCQAVTLPSSKQNFVSDEETSTEAATGSVSTAEEDKCRSNNNWKGAYDCDSSRRSDEWAADLFVPTGRSEIALAPLMDPAPLFRSPTPPLRPPERMEFDTVLFNGGLASSKTMSSSSSDMDPLDFSNGIDRFFDLEKKELEPVAFNTKWFMPL